MLITVIAFAALAYPLINAMHKKSAARTQEFIEAEKVETPEDFAKALKSDGLIFAKGEITGKAPLEQLREGARAMNVENLLLSNRKMNDLLDEALSSLRGDYLSAQLEIGITEIYYKNEKGEWIKEDKLNIFETRGAEREERFKRLYNASAKADTYYFLGQEFKSGDITISVPDATKELELSSPPYEAKLKTHGSPHKCWLEVKVDGGKIKDISYQSEANIKKYNDAAAGKDDKGAATIGFLVFWLIALGIVLWLENKYIKR